IISYFPADFGRSNFQLGGAYLLKNNSLLFESGNGMGLIQNYRIQWNQPTHRDITNFYEDSKDNVFLCLNHGKGLEKYSSVDMLQKGKSQSYLSGLSAVNITEDQEA